MCICVFFFFCVHTLLWQQQEVRMRCSGPVTTLHQGKVGVRTLATKDGKQYTEIGYDFEQQVAGTLNSVHRSVECMYAM